MDKHSSSSAPYALVVEDDGLIRMDIVEILSDAGFRTYEAATSDEGAILLERERQSIVLLFSDVQMPGSLDGFGLARKAAQCWPHISIVVASGHVCPGPNDLPEGVRFIDKPFTAGMVHDHLKEILPDGQKPEPLKD
ncbi:response regulator [Methylobacterium sp. J-090]|uniref:response regulator n=1 Tax=Methylobacterium sp. J-090 TaxID=2836666 RepID=UPI001FB8B3E6|nr:response regulator [Methylobacterium sp. J-090]MCJ2079884.1 response regulator [Methylobacterium sp. J-090]